MVQFLDLTSVEHGHFKSKVSSLPLLEDYVIALKIKKTEWYNPVRFHSTMSEEDRYYLEMYHDEDDNFIYQDKSESKEHINPFDTLNMFWNDTNYFVMTNKRYHNKFSATLDVFESEVLRELLSKRIGYQACYGERSFIIDEIIPANIHLINEINQKWNCENSKKIQDWYYENNSQYRNEIKGAGGTEEKVITNYYEEIFISTLSSEDTKAFVANHIKRGTILPKGQRFIPIRELKEPVTINSSGMSFAGPEILCDEERDEQLVDQIEYETQKRIFEAENPHINYTDHLYYERVRDGEE